MRRRPPVYFLCCGVDSSSTHNTHTHTHRDWTERQTSLCWNRCWEGVLLLLWISRTVETFRFGCFCCCCRWWRSEAMQVNHFLGNRDPTGYKSSISMWIYCIFSPQLSRTRNHFCFCSLCVESLNMVSGLDEEERCCWWTTEKRSATRSH